ncbi:hypothetical protein L596_019335 [Steinernema carpocapsae]|uniref:Choline/carnitine acyltransferase domain-containing protein n=1 Tax=Steinernema carpocapsae TaxID=34508 RepID=A0A4U5MQC3_STECR|nr:hypothetical protein L596_019335 [Steinernema carpocapsae]
MLKVSRLPTFHALSPLAMGKLSMVTAPSTLVVPVAPEPTLKLRRGYCTLPKFGVPPLEETVKKFVRFARPIQDDDQFKKTVALAKKFMDSEGHELQKLLEKRSQKLENWLTPWWLNVAYLEGRTPLPVVTSPGVMFPKFDYSGLDGQVDAAAKMIQAALSFYHRICNDELPQDKAGNIPFDMSQYKFLFGTTRIPRVGKDVIKYGKDLNPPSEHIIVMRNGHMFKVPVYDEGGEMLGLNQLKSLIENFVIPNSEARARHPIGIVSSDERDSWAKVYTKLQENNLANLHAIEDALFVVCLDNQTELRGSLTPRDEQARQALHGGGSKANSINRWFDKTIQFVIGFDGYCGMTYEHTPAEGPPIAMLMDFVVDQFLAMNFESEGGAGGKIAKVQQLKFDLDKATMQAIEASKKKMDDVVRDLDVRSYTFEHFGKNVPKSHKISPDSFIQIAFQLAFYRLHNTHPPTYETATLRKFAHGRTDTIRLPNLASAQFVSEIAARRSPNDTLASLLRSATTAHKNYSVEAMHGKGMDRHLLGLKLIAAENKIPLPALLKSPAMEKMLHFQVSTSQVPTKHFIQMCFGPSAPDCYGICYNPQEKELHFTISSFRSCAETSSSLFAKELENALLDMRNVLEKADKTPKKSKL